LEIAFERYEAAAREHAFVHAEVIHRIHRNEALTKREIGAVEAARIAVDDARAALKASLDVQPMS
jgi:hypothetical protein